MFKAKTQINRPLTSKVWFTHSERILIAATVALAISALPLPVLAQTSIGGLDQGTNIMKSIATWLLNIASLAGAICCIAAGLKVMMQGRTFDEVSKLFWGGMIILVGPQVIKYFTSNSSIS